ncbi:hypothetical protein IU459_33665 [Nocardia amamiensis]|uniref:DUF8175 domain-containing protein n=1 Tax=Nocardia amamiensis TaxID=404578 RepID=A0ABS0D0S6_9NOCA|nr:hypothetical protein [Nocardia amamiensis]MBF6302452.1 hypothetical protein [Nocardia amamiensis]
MTSGQHKPSPGQRPVNVWTVASVSLLALIMIAASIAFAVRRTDTATSASPSAATDTTSAPPAVTGEGFDVPEVDAFGRRVDIPRNPAGQLRDQTVRGRQPSDPDWLSAPPAGLREPGGWQRVHGAVVPFSTSDGPTRIGDGLAAGYARTPQGAALAAAASVNQVAARPGDRAVVAARMVLTAADQAAFDAGIAAGKLPRQQPESVTRTLLAPDGFRIDSYAADLAVLRLAAHAQREPSGIRSWLTVTVPMVWHDGDWRIRGNGRQLPTETVTDLTGWTLWS